MARKEIKGWYLAARPSTEKVAQISSEQATPQQPTQRQMAYKVVAYFNGRAYSLYDKKFTYDLTIGKVMNNIYLGTSEQFCLDYYSGAIDEPELLLTFSYDPKDIISGGGPNSEVQVRQARLEGYRNIPKDV